MNRRMVTGLLTIDEIRKRLPHRYPFLMVDRVLELEEGVRAVARKNVTINEPFFQGHYPEEPIMPGVMIVEAMAQVGGLAAGGTKKGLVPLFAAIDKAKFRRLVKPGDVLTITVEILRARGSIAKVAARAEVDGELAAEGVLTFALVKRGDEAADGTA